MSSSVALQGNGNRVTTRGVLPKAQGSRQAASPDFALKGGGFRGWCSKIEQPFAAARSGHDPAIPELTRNNPLKKTAFAKALLVMNGFTTGFQARVPVPCSATLEPHRPQHGPSRKRSTPGTDMPIPISAIGLEQHSQQTFLAVFWLLHPCRSALARWNKSVSDLAHTGCDPACTGYDAPSMRLILPVT